MVREVLVEDVIKLMRTDERLIEIKIVWGRRIARIFTVYVL